jgi:hypothetical protein
MSKQEEERKATTTWRHLPEPKARIGGGSQTVNMKMGDNTRRWLKAKPHLEHDAKKIIEKDE